MNKRKVAVFVEGQTELVFLRDYVQKHYRYDSSKVGFECINLRGNTSQIFPHKWGDQNSEVFYQFINVGNDCSVLSKMKAYAPKMKNQGFGRIIGLRDMYSKSYRELNKKQEIDPKLNDEFICEADKQILKSACPEIMQIHFSIMEVEAWLLGMPQFMERLNRKLTPAHIKEATGIDIFADPETSYYHPSKELSTIFKSVGSIYDKHYSDISAISNCLFIEDYERLIQSGNCKSFRTFSEALLSPSA